MFALFQATGDVSICCFPYWRSGALFLFQETYPGLKMMRDIEIKTRIIEGLGIIIVATKMTA
jgi:hypothetical protein